MSEAHSNSLEREIGRQGHVLSEGLSQEVVMAFRSFESIHRRAGTAGEERRPPVASPLTVIKAPFIFIKGVFSKGPDCNSSQSIPRVSRMKGIQAIFKWAKSEISFHR